MTERDYKVDLEPLHARIAKLDMVGKEFYARVHNGLFEPAIEAEDVTDEQLAGLLNLVMVNPPQQRPEND